MGEMEIFQERLKTVQIPDEQKTALLDVFKTMSQKYGSTAEDLSRTKADLEAAKGNSSEFTKLLRMMSDSGIEANKAEEILAKMNVKKTQEDTLKILEDTIKTERLARSKIEGELNSRIKKDKVLPFLEQAILNFKTEEGKDYKILKKFVDMDKVLELDDSSEVILSDGIKRTLLEARQSQDQFLKELGAEDLNSFRLHPNVTGDNRDGAGIDQKQVQELIKTSGVAAGIDAIRNQTIKGK